MSTAYAPSIYNALRGILMVYKPAGIHSIRLIEELKAKISDQLNQYEARPIETRLVIEGNYDEEKKLIEVPNLADHPLVVGPRYNPWEVRMVAFPTFLTQRMSGVFPLLVGRDIKYYYGKFKRIRLVSIYEITGHFGYTTQNMFSDGHIVDKATYKHIKPWKVDGVLSKIETTQRNRLFDSANVPLDSEEAYQLAKAWPSRPPRMAIWPVIYRLRCTHFKLPEIKFEVTVTNENEKFLAHLCQDIAMELKSSACTHSIRRLKSGPFDISDCLTSSEWDLQSIINNLKIHSDYKKMHRYLDSLNKSIGIRTTHNSGEVPAKIDQHQRSTRYG